jgi:tripartite-type tricarboxylate transporter receptor subunit TctC
LLPHHKSGKLRIISSMAEAREKISPDIPTAREAGYDLIAGTSNLLAAPQGTPADVVEHLARSTVRAMQKPSVQQRLDQLGIQAFAKSSPELARQYVAAEVNRWSAVVKKLGIAL